MYSLELLNFSVVYDRGCLSPDLFAIHAYSVAVMERRNIGCYVKWAMCEHCALSRGHYYYYHLLQ